MTFPYVFEKSKLATVLKHTETEVLVDANIHPHWKTPSVSLIQNALDNNLPVSTSGRNLVDILSLSHPENLSSYSILNVRSIWGKTRANYSRDEPSTADLLKEIKGLKAEIEQLKAEVMSMKSHFQSQDSTMLAWEVSNLVFHAFGTFIWKELADETIAQLASHNITNFSNLFYSYLSKERGVAEVAAKKAYHSIDIAIAHYAIFIHGCKKAASRVRANVAHPPVSQTDLDNFLDDHLGGNREDLSPLQVKLFDFLRATSISPSNIQGARTSR